MADRPVQVHLRCQLAPGRWGDLLAFLDDAIPFYEAPGDIRIRLLRSGDDPDRFIEVVEYGNRAAYERDRDRVESDPTMGDLLARWRELLAAPPEVAVFEEIPRSRPAVGHWTE